MYLSPHRYDFSFERILHQRLKRHENKNFCFVFLFWCCQQEEENDQDFGSDDASGSEDEVDSDFDIDENDDVVSGGEDEEGKGGRKRKAGAITRAYKDPKGIMNIQRIRINTQFLSSTFFTNM